MDRKFDPVYRQARDAVEVLLDRAEYRLASEVHHPDAFGSAEAEYRARHERLRLTWDGKDRWLRLSIARVQNSGQHPAHGAWSALEPRTPAGPQQFLRPGAGAEARIADLVAALREHLGEAV